MKVQQLLLYVFTGCNSEHLIKSLYINFKGHICKRKKKNQQDIVDFIPLIFYFFFFRTQGQLIAHD